MNYQPTHAEILEIQRQSNSKSPHSKTPHSKSPHSKTTKEEKAIQKLKLTKP